MLGFSCSEFYLLVYFAKMQFFSLFFLPWKALLNYAGFSLR